MAAPATGVSQTDRRRRTSRCADGTVPRSLGAAPLWSATGDPCGRLSSPSIGRVDKPPLTHRIPSSHPGELSLEEYGNSWPGRAPILFLPALGVPLAYYRPLLTAWATRDRHVFGLESRGMPYSNARSLRRSPFGYSILVRHDLPAVAAALPTEGRPIVVGHSLGGQLAILSAAIGLIDPLAIVTIATGSSTADLAAPLVARMRRWSEIATVRLVSRLLGYWPGHRLGFGGRQPFALMRDWAQEARTGRYRLHGDETDYEAALGHMPAPIALVAIDGDPLITPRSVEHLRRRLHRSSTALSVRAGARDHFLWARREPERVIDAVESWTATL
jgi:predicted alpha/beta hydrolase